MRSSIQAAMARSQGQRSVSVSGIPARILATFAAGWKSSASANRQPRRPASRAPTVVLPLPETPATITITRFPYPSCVAAIVAWEILAGRWFTPDTEGYASTVERRRSWIGSWPVYRQLTGADHRGLGAAAKSDRSRAARTSTADQVVKSVCPYCAVGCGQNVFVKDDKVVQIEGDPDSPVSRGRLCPKGSASLQLTTGDSRQYTVRYRRPFGTKWEDLDLDTAMDMIADRVLAARRHGWQWDVDGNRTRRTLGFASLGGATLDNEENYLIKKLFTALGAIQIENQARI